MALLGSLFGMGQQGMGQAPSQQPPVQRVLPQQQDAATQITSTLGGLFGGLSPQTQPTQTPTSEAFPNLERLKALLNSGVMRRNPQAPPMQPPADASGQAANAAAQMANRGGTGMDFMKKLMTMGM